MRIDSKDEFEGETMSDAKDPIIVESEPKPKKFDRIWEIHLERKYNT